MAKIATKNLKEKVCKAAKQVAEVVQNTKLDVAFYFPCPVYAIERPDFLDAVSVVSEENLAIARSKQELNEIYPMVTSNNYYDDPRVAAFAQFVGATAWNILSEQGYNMQNNAVQFMEMWTQEHYKHSAMDQHVHGYGSQIVGFYFLETPENCSRLVIHDPRSAKIQIDLPEQDINIVSPATKLINYIPKPGTLIFTNSWLAHSFSRHAADLPIKFVHFNLSVITNPQTCSVSAPVEII